MSKLCKVCREPNANALATACSPHCALVLVKRGNDKAYKAETRRRKEAIKTAGEWTAETQTAFNAFIRARDEANNQPCISCNSYYSEPFNGQLWDAGHFKPISTHMELRFNELNCHRQHARCNRGAAKSGRNDRTVSEQYRINLINRVGLGVVEWLEKKHPPLKITIEELRFLKKYYRHQTREVQKWRGA